MSSNRDVADQAVESLYAQVKRYGSIWALSPIAPTVSAAAVLLHAPISRKIPLVRPSFLFSGIVYPAVFAGSAYMNYAGYPIDAAGTMGAWSVLYLSMNVGRKTMGFRSSGTGLRMGLAGLMAANAVGGCGVYLLGWRPKLTDNNGLKPFTG